MTEEESYMTDDEALQLLRLLWRYVRYAGDQPPDDIKISALTADLAMSMEPTTDEADYLRWLIEEAVR